MPGPPNGSRLGCGEQAITALASSQRSVVPLPRPAVRPAGDSISPGAAQPTAHLKLQRTSRPLACHEPAPRPPAPSLAHIHAGHAATGETILDLKCPSQGRRSPVHCSESTSDLGGAKEIRTPDLLQAIHAQPVARRGQASPDVPFTCADSGRTSLSVVSYLSLLAPRACPWLPLTPPSWPTCCNTSATGSAATGISWNPRLRASPAARLWHPAAARRPGSLHLPARRQ